MQSWNWPAVQKCFKLVGDRGPMKPNLMYQSVKDIDWGSLKNSYGVSSVCFDKDNTLTAPYDDNIHNSVKDNVYKCMKMFEGRVAVFSNSIGASEFDPNFEKATVFEANTGITVIRHMSKKPDGAKEILEHFKEQNPKRVAFIGDRILTDIVLANEAGFLSVLIIEPITLKNDNLFALIARIAEKTLLKYI